MTESDAVVHDGSPRGSGGSTRPAGTSTHKVGGVPSVPAAADADTFGTVGLRTHFRGPYADGPPPEALVVEYPDIHRFGAARAGADGPGGGDPGGVRRPRRR